MHNCKFCNQEFDNSRKLSGHTTWCDLNPSLSKNKSACKVNNKFINQDKASFHCDYCNQDLLMTVTQFGIHNRWCDKNPNRKPSKKKIRHLNSLRVGSQELSKLLSEKKKAYLSLNKGKHSWSRYNNVESKPEKVFRLFAEKTNIPLIQYYIPPESNRFFEMDFANLEHKICFEINGNQHYLEDRKTLAPYYQNRHDHFVSLGWKVLEIHYALCFNEANIETILKESFIDFQKCEEKIQEIANGRVERKEKKLKKKIEESKKVQVDFTKKPHTQKEIAYFFKRRKVDRPTKEELYQMLWSMPTTKIALHFGVSDKCIEKWAKGYGISKPAPGYWRKLETNKL